MMWFDRGHPDAVFGDCRRETLTVTDRSHGRQDGTRTLRIEPDVVMGFRCIPYPDNTFKLVAFDPPHLERAGPKSWMAAKYVTHKRERADGKREAQEEWPEDWPEDLDPWARPDGYAPKK